MYRFSCKDLLNRKSKKIKRHPSVDTKQAKKIKNTQEYELNEVHDKFLLKGISEEYMNSIIVKCGNNWCRNIKRKIYYSHPLVVEDVINITGDSCKELCKCIVQPQVNIKVKVENYKNKVDEKFIQRKTEELNKLQNYLEYLKSIYETNNKLEIQLESIINNKSSKFDLSDDNTGEEDNIQLETPIILHQQMKQIADNINIHLRDKLNKYILYSQKISAYNSIKPMLIASFNELMGFDNNFNLKKTLK